MLITECFAKYKDSDKIRRKSWSMLHGTCDISWLKALHDCVQEKKPGIPFQLWGFEEELAADDWELAEDDALC